MSETKQLPAIIDAIGRAWFLCARHDEGQDITGRKFYGERAATTDDIAAVLAALPADDRNDIIGPFLLDERMSEGHWMAHWVDTAKLAHEGQQMLTKEAESRAEKLESELSACTVELNDERAKVGLMMQPMPGEKFPSESSPVWRMLQQWTANRDVEKRSERERVSRLESELSAEKARSAEFQKLCESAQEFAEQMIEERGVAVAELSAEREAHAATRLALWNAAPPSPPPAEVCGTCDGTRRVWDNGDMTTCGDCSGSGRAPTEETAGKDGRAPETLPATLPVGSRWHHPGGPWQEIPSVAVYDAQSGLYRWEQEEPGEKTWASRPSCIDWAHYRTLTPELPAIDSTGEKETENG